jgi:hypothetical protein
MIMNSVPCRVIFLFKCCRSLKLGQQKVKLLVVLVFFYFSHSSTEHRQVFLVLVTKARWVFYLFFSVGKKFFFFFFVAFATLVNANLKKNKDCWRRGASFN